jgi:hypothetical protein
MRLEICFFLKRAIFIVYHSWKLYKIFQKIKSVSFQTQISSIYYTELHVSTYLMSSLRSQLVFKTY